MIKDQKKNYFPNHEKHCLLKTRISFEHDKIK